MHKAVFTLQGVTDIMFGQATRSPKLDTETHDQHEKRTWEEKVPVTSEGQLYMNPFAITNGLVEAGAWLKRKIPGEARATFTKRFLQGVAPGDKLLIFNASGKPATMKDIDPIRLFVPSDGTHGGPKRVWKTFPTLHKWSAQGSVYVFDGKITEEIFRDHLVCLGQFICIGSMRVGNGGINGRYTVTSCEFEKLVEAA